jgi:hypothetical protein
VVGDQAIANSAIAAALAMAGDLVFDRIAPASGDDRPELIGRV